jgi:hypothetical protein
MKDHGKNISFDLAAHKACINIHIESIKQLCTTNEPLEELRTLYQIAHKLFQLIQTYDQRLKACRNTSWLKGTLQSLSFFKKSHPSIEKESERFIFFSKMATYEILYPQAERQINALKAEVEGLFTIASFFKSPESNRYRLQNPIELTTIIKIVKQTSWIHSFLALLQNHSPTQHTQNTQESVATHLTEILNQIKTLFHAIYTQSIKHRMILVMGKLNKLPQLYDMQQPSYLMHITQQITYIQSYADYCILPDEKLHNEITIFNRCILACLGSDHPQLAIVLRAQKTIDSTGASIHHITPN